MNRKNVAGWKTFPRNVINRETTFPPARLGPSNKCKGLLHLTVKYPNSLKHLFISGVKYPNSLLHF